MAEEKKAKPTEGNIQRLRFRVRTEDGRELISSIAEVAYKGEISSPQWSKAEHKAGEKAALSLAAPGRDGEKVDFVIERRDGGHWERIGRTSGTVQGGKVKVEHELPRLPPKPDEQEHKIEYHAPAGGAAHGAAAQHHEAAPKGEKKAPAAHKADAEKKPEDKKEPFLFHVTLSDAHGAPYAGRKFKLQVGPHAYEGTTGPDGKIEQKLDEHAGHATLSLLADSGHPDDAQTYEVELGDLPPVSEPAGAQARLSAMGYSAGSSGTLDEHLIAALKEFQEQHMDHDHVTGHLDAETQKQLDLAYNHR